MKEYLKYFAYGSNMHPERLRQRVPSSRFLEVVRLESHQLYFHKRHPDGSGKCNIIYTAEPHHQVIGTLYQMLTTEKSLLDDAEGVGHGYHVCEVSLLGRQGTHQAFAYSADADYIDDRLLPYDWYKALVLIGARTHGLPATYIQQLEQQAARVDEDQTRTKLHMQIINGGPDRE